MGFGLKDSPVLEGRVQTRGFSLWNAKLRNQATRLSEVLAALRAQSRSMLVVLVGKAG